MLPIYLFCIFMLSAIANISAKENEYFERIDSIIPEIPCTTVGGTCVLASDCAQEQRASDGLCPQQQRLGVECCYGISVRETRCQRRGGHCVGVDSRCPDPLVYREATDCSENEKCCILV